VLQRLHHAMAPARKLQPVVVSDRETEISGSLVLITAAGERLEGLGADEAARVLRALR